MCLRPPDGNFNVVGQYSLIVTQSSHAIHDVQREKFQSRIVWSHLVHSVLASVGSEVDLMPATRRYDVSHTCVMVTVFAV